jgi:hypothetical protein
MGADRALQLKIIAEAIVFGRHSSYRGRSAMALALAGVFLATDPAAAQDVPARDTTPVPAVEAAASDMVVLGLRRGIDAARYESTTNWVWGGFIGGLTLGPIGAGLAWTLANNSDVALGVDRRMVLHLDGGATYIQAFEQAYAQALLDRRKRSALRGGILGTAGLVAAATAIWAVNHY